MPGWHEATKELQEQGKVQMVGIIEEQHPGRCRLFMQWKQMGWPIMVDSLNLLEVEAVPLTFAIDEHGVIRHERLKLDDAAALEADFLSRTYEAPSPETDPAGPPDLGQLQAWTRQGTVDAWRRYANALYLWGGEQRLDEAIDAYREAIAIDPEHGPTHFRLGVALRHRYDFGGGGPSDFRAAVESWKQALDLDPNQYIWRRRIQQYGPRLDKPYSFYDWVNTAREEITARGETPVELGVEPGGAEFAYPSETFTTTTDAAVQPDADGRIHRDERGFVKAEAIVVPPVLAPGESGRVHLTFRPDTSIKAHWNNEAGDMQVWLEPAGGWEVSDQLLTTKNPPELVSIEPRTVEFEVQVPANAGQGTTELDAYALYYVCEDVGGTCLYRRQDLSIPVEVGP